MISILMNGWNEGLDKVALTKLQMEILGMSLINSKNNVDELLDNNVITLNAISVAIAHNFYDSATKIGVICEIID